LRLCSVLSNSLGCESILDFIYQQPCTLYSSG